jgi:hypothetical protein
MKSRFLSSILVPISASLLLSPLAHGGLVIHVTAPGFTTEALDAFHRGAALWSQFIENNFTVEVSAGFGTLNPDVLGSSLTTVYNDRSYEVLAGQMKADATTSASLFDDQAKLLPATTALFKSEFPAGYNPNGWTNITSANDKALFGDYGGLDAALTFSNRAGVVFDYDNRNGVDLGSFDFESVVAHEIGHALGFFSSLDLGQPQQPTPLDLFRFSQTDPSKRNLTLGVAAVTDVGTLSYEMSTGVSGDGYQASHWKNGLSIGLMNPSLSPATIYVPSVADLKTLDLIGYDIDYSAVPEVSTLSLGLLSLLGVLRHRRES